MPADTVYLLRHGDSSRDDVRRYIGQTDQPLNETGRAQAEFWRRELSTVSFQTVFSSDLSRSIETAGIIVRGRGNMVKTLTGLREINLGDWDGMPMGEVCRRYPAEYEQRGANLAEHRPPGGESFNDLADRVLPLFEEIVNMASGNLLIVGHAGVNRIILSHLLMVPREKLFQLHQEYGCLNIIDRSTEGLSPLHMNIVPDLFYACLLSDDPH